MEKMMLHPETLSEKFRRGDLMAAECPSREVLKHLTSRWGVLVMIALEDGETRRFSQLKRAIGGVSERMLAQTLQWLEADGLVLRIAHDVVPPHVDYRLTPLGNRGRREGAPAGRLGRDQPAADRSGLGGSRGVIHQGGHRRN
jgi:DNA-binding HxlR family transcriptional regulator